MPPRWNVLARRLVVAAFEAPEAQRAAHPTSGRSWYVIPPCEPGASLLHAIGVALWLTKRTPENFSFIRGFGGSEGTRTPDPLHAMQVRYQLRHRPGRPIRGNETSLHQPVPAYEIEGASAMRAASVSCSRRAAAALRTERAASG